MAGPATFNIKFAGKMKSIDSLLESTINKKMLVVFPHPDDESVMAGGLIQRAMAGGYQVTVLTLTEGGRGKIHISGRGRSSVEIRRQEMALAMSGLGVSDWIMWKFVDGKLRKTHRWKERLSEFIADTNPGLVVTYDLSGVSGHPDHISLSLEVLRTLKKLKNAKLLWVSFDEEHKQKMVDERVGYLLQGPEYILDLSLGESRRKWRSAFAHQSQNLRGYLKAPWWLLVIRSRAEWYSEAEFSRKYKYKFVKFKI